MSTPDDAHRILESVEWLAPDGRALAPLLVEHGRLIHRPAGAWVHAERATMTPGCSSSWTALSIFFLMELASNACVSGSLDPGTAVGQSVRFGGGPRLVTAAAATPCAILLVSDAALTRVAERQPEIWRAIAKLLYGQLRYALRFGADMLTLPPSRRIAARLSDLAAVTAGLDGLPLSQEALGEMTGLTRKTVNAVLRQLQADGLLVCDYRKIMIRDADRLRDLARVDGEN
jgi:CRP/FNR family transcriptional regulator, cyclic AMP receptor protein